MERKEGKRVSLLHLLIQTLFPELTARAEDSRWVDIDEPIPEEPKPAEPPRKGRAQTQPQKPSAPAPRQAAIPPPTPEQIIARVERNELRWKSLSPQAQMRLKEARKKYLKLTAHKRLSLDRKLALWRALSETERDQIRQKLKTTKS